LIIIPAIDLKDGKCVRLEQGLMNRETIFSDHPEEIALQWERKGAKRLHIVDLDGAVYGKPYHKRIIKGILDMVSIPIELGGGIRDLDTIAYYLDLGIDKIILGTIALKNPGMIQDACIKYPDKIIISIDSKDNYVSVEGWTEPTGIIAIDLARRFEDIGIAAVIYTDIRKDGMRSGPNIDGIREFAKNINIGVIAAGGISSIKDIEQFLPLEELGVCGIITGRALYDGSIALEEAIDILNK
jgi:phosphoribosylformimino-5-aminoimidazole carboxamide ribotide isomerase